MPGRENESTWQALDARGWRAVSTPTRTDREVLQWIDVVSETDCHVYVIDDEPSVRASIVDLLDSAGIQTSAFESPEQFLESYQPRAGLECIVADYRMPGINGLELKRELNARQCRVPVILLTGYRDGDTDTRAAELGVFALLEKPFPPVRLLELAQSALAGEQA